MREAQAGAILGAAWLASAPSFRARSEGRPSFWKITECDSVQIEPSVGS